MAPITVSAIHLLTTAACVALLEALGVFGSEEKGQSMPKKHLAVFVLISKSGWRQNADVCIQACANTLKTMLPFPDLSIAAHAMHVQCD
eukprot:scaffold39533_cov23-Tisochrysis_lutea.AAC.1